MGEPEDKKEKGGEKEKKVNWQKEKRGGGGGAWGGKSKNKCDIVAERAKGEIRNGDSHAKDRERVANGRMESSGE